VYEEYAGWFHQERTSELYPAPSNIIWAELVEDAGGVEHIVKRARHHLSVGQIESALHYVEMAVFVDPHSKAVRETELAVLEELADRTEGKVFDLLGWLEGRIMAARTALSQSV
jgi:alkyl sulfatase BDS1-like metallo-beta-lactamase superfamily hydrolase